LSRLPVSIINSWYQREGYIRSMADLIEKELESFSEPREVSFILVLNTLSLKLGIRPKNRLFRGVQSHHPLVLNTLDMVIVTYDFFSEPVSRAYKIQRLYDVFYSNLNRGIPIFFFLFFRQ
jgi:hypothetical protein